MADEVTDVYIATETGDAGWQSLTSLVEAKLPIESVDGTVTLDSPSANTFAISTGGTERVKVENFAATFNGDIRTSKVVGTAFSTDASISLGANLAINVFNQEFLFGGYSADYSGGTICGAGASSNYIWSKADNGFSIASDRIAFNSNVSGGAAGCNWSMETDGNFVGATGAGIEAGFISAGRNNAGVAAIGLGVDVTVTAVGQIIVYSGYDADYVGDTTCGLGASSNYIWSKSDNGLAVLGNRIRFNSNESGGIVGCNWSMETDGNFVGATGAGIEVNVISAGRNNAGDSSVELGADFAFSTNGQATLKQNNGSAYVATSPDSLVTEKLLSDRVDNMIWVGTTAEYQAIGIYNNKTLYCITD